MKVLNDIVFFLTDFELFVLGIEGFLSIGFTFVENIVHVSIIFDIFERGVDAVHFSVLRMFGFVSCFFRFLEEVWEGLWFVFFCL